METHSNVLAWRIPRTGEPGGLPSVRLHRDGHDWCDLAAAAAAGSIILLDYSWCVCWSGSWLYKCVPFLKILHGILITCTFPYVYCTSIRISVHYCCCSVAKLCPTLCNFLDCSPLGSSVHGILQARILEWVAIPFSRGSSRPRAWTRVSCGFCTGRQIPYHWTNWEAHTKYTSSYFLLLQ